MALDLAQIARSGPLSADLAQKQAALEAWLSGVLALHAAATDARAWTVVGYADPRLMAAGYSPADRDAVMGAPARYAEVLWTGRADGYDPTAPALTFDVGVYYGTGAVIASPTLVADTATAFAAFRSVCYRADAARPGVLYAAERQVEMVTADGSAVALGTPQAVTAGRIPSTARGTTPELLALSFTLTLA